MNTYKFKTKPWPHQVKAFKYVYRHLRDYGSAGLQVPMRYGKSKIAVDAISACSLEYGVRRALIVTTTSGMAVWHAEIDRHCPYRHAIRDHKGELIASTLQVPDLQFMVTHHALLYGREFGWDEDNPRSWQTVPNAAIINFDPEFIVIDESHKIGTVNSMQCKMAYKYGKSAKFRMNLTGTSFHRGPRFLFGQFKFLDDSIFGTVEKAFNTEFIRFGGHGGYEIVGYQNLKTLAQKVKSRLFIAEKLPPKRPPIVSTLPVPMDECGPKYREMVRESAIVLDGKPILSTNILSRHLRCQQIAGGWIKDEDGKTHRVGKEKRRALEDQLTLAMEEGITHIVIGTRFIAELRDIAEASKGCGFTPLLIHGAVSPPDRAKRVEQFTKRTSPVVMACQVQAAAEAIDLSAAQDLWFYSIPESYVIYDQFKARIEKYNEQRTLRYNHFIMQRSRDEVTYQAMLHNQDVATYLVKNPAYVERICAREDAFFRPA